MQRQKELFQNTIIIGIGSIFTKVISFILVPLFTLWLTTSEYGDYDLLFSYVSLLVPVITLQIEQAVLRFTLKDESKGEEFLKTSLGLVSINSVILLLVFGFLFRFEYHYSFIFCTIAYSFQVVITEYLRGKNQLRAYSVFNILCGLLTILLSFVLVKVLHLGVDGLLVAFGLSYLSTAISIVISKRLYRQLLPFSVDYKALQNLLMYSLPLLPNAISWWVTNVSDRTLIRLFLGNSYNGIYAVSTKIPTLIAVFYSIFNLAWQQSAILSWDDDFVAKKTFYTNTFEKLFLFLFSSGLGIIALTPILYEFLLGEEYQTGMAIVPILILGTIFLNLSQYLGGILLGKMDTKTNGYTTIIAAILNIIVNLLLISKYGILAAAISTLMSYIVMFFLRLYKLKDLFNMDRIVFHTILGSLTLVSISIFIYQTNNLLLQLFNLVLVAVGFIVINRSLFYGILKQLKGK